MRKACQEGSKMCVWMLESFSNDFKAQKLRLCRYLAYMYIHMGKNKQNTVARSIFSIFHPGTDAGRGRLSSAICRSRSPVLSTMIITDIEGIVVRTGARELRIVLNTRPQLTPMLRSKMFISLRRLSTLP